jgi:signal-transduction protein with cAMP-binding, CBS, and nucleotidyltransferase domain
MTSLESTVQELKVLINEIAKKMAKLSKLSHEMYFMTRLVDELYEKVIEARDIAKKIERMVEENRNERVVR